MSFTQEKKINVRKCEGCEKRCKLGFDVQKKLRTIPAKTFLGICIRPKMTVCDKTVYPTIDGKVINSYYDKNGNNKYTGLTSSGLSEQEYYEFPQSACFTIAEATIDMARKIARLCDNYKQR